MKLVHRPLMGGMLHLVSDEGLGLTVPNVTAHHQRPCVPITAMIRCCAVFNVPIKGLRYRGAPNNKIHTAVRRTCCMVWLPICIRQTSRVPFMLRRHQLQHPKAYIWWTRFLACWSYCLESPNWGTSYYYWHISVLNVDSRLTFSTLPLLFGVCYWWLDLVATRVHFEFHDDDWWLRVGFT